MTGELEAALLAVEAACPGWVAWQGTTPMFYARRLKTSPPVIVRAATLDGLRAEIERETGGKPDAS